MKQQTAIVLIIALAVVVAAGFLWWRGALSKKIMVTNELKHSIPLDEIIGGGPPKDGIPSLDAPKFVSVSEATFITDNEPGLAVSMSGIDRFYPFQILVWHEIVNDTGARASG